MIEDDKLISINEEKENQHADKGICINLWPVINKVGRKTAYAFNSERNGENPEM